MWTGGLRLSRLSRPSQEASDGKRLKRAFRKLCLRYHPDIAREEGAVEKFQELQEAYRKLVLLPLQVLLLVFLEV